MLGLLNTVLSRGGSLLTYVKDGLVMANRFLTPPKLSHPAQGSAEFNGTSDYIQLNDPFSHTNHTIAAWVYPNGAGNQKYFFDNRDTNNDGIVLISWSDERILYQINGANIFSTDTIINDWVFVVATYDGTTQKLYFDGSLQGSQATNKTIDVAFNAVIGRSGYSASEYFNGNLANVAIWNRALSSDEINSVMWKSYEALSGTESNGLQAWYALDDITSPAASLANMQQLATDKNATIENTAAITAAINSLS
jgi:hypothetical protein